MYLLRNCLCFIKHIEVNKCTKSGEYLAFDEIVMRTLYIMIKYGDKIEKNPGLDFYGKRLDSTPTMQYNVRTLLLQRKLIMDLVGNTIRHLRKI